MTVRFVAFNFFDRGLNNINFHFCYFVLLQGADFEPCRSRCSLPGLTALLTPTQGNAYGLALVKKTPRIQRRQGRLFVRRTVTLSTFFLFSLSAEELERGHKEGNAADC